MESDPALNVYSEAKSEYMLQLCSYLTPAYFNFYLDRLEKAKEESKEEPKKYLWHFQNLLAAVEDWNMERVTREVNNIISVVARHGCDFIEDLLTAVFIAHTKVLTAIRLNSKQKKVQITVPKIEHFLFKVFCECSRLLWENAYLWRDNVGGMEKQQNYRQIQILIENGIKAAIRVLVPVKSLLKDCVSATPEADGNDSDSDDEETAAPVEESQLHIPEETPIKALIDPPVEAPVEAPVVAPAVVEEPIKSSEPVTEPLPEIKESVTEPLNTLAVEHQDEKTVTQLPIDKRKVNVFKNDEVVNVEEANKPPAQNIIFVDEDRKSKGVIFNEYETIFDIDDEDGHHMQPTTFPELENRPPEDDDEEDESLEILDEVGTPLGDADFDDPNDFATSAVSFDDYEEAF